MKDVARLSAFLGAACLFAYLTDASNDAGIAYVFCAILGNTLYSFAQIIDGLQDRINQIEANEEARTHALLARIDDLLED